MPTVESEELVIKKSMIGFLFATFFFAVAISILATIFIDDYNGVRRWVLVGVFLGSVILVAWKSYEYFKKSKGKKYAFYFYLVWMFVLLMVGVILLPALEMVLREEIWWYFLGFALFGAILSLTYGMNNRLDW